MIVPLYAASGYIIDPRTGDISFRWEVASFDPIPDREADTSPDHGKRKGVVGGSRPHCWVKSPALSRVAELPSATGPSKVVLLGGEKSSGRAAWVVLARARAGDPDFLLVDPPASEVARPGRAIDLYAGAMTIVHVPRDLVVVARATWDLDPIEAREWSDEEGLFRYRQEGASSPSCRAIIPDSAERVGSLVRLAPGDRGPWWSADRLAFHAAAGRSGLSLAPGSGDPREIERSMSTIEVRRPVQVGRSRGPVGQATFAWAS